MFHSATAAALRHLARNRLYAAIGILGLAVGLAGALLALLIVRDQYSQDHFIPGHQRIHLAMNVVTPPGQPAIYLPSTNTFTGAMLRQKFSAIEAVARLYRQDFRLTREQISSLEAAYWADPQIFELLPLPVVAGELGTALDRPDAIVLTRSLARKYFGRDAPLGESLLLEGVGPVAVTAVIEDLPEQGTHLGAGIFLSTLSPRSQLQLMDRNSANVPGSDIGFGTLTYLRLAPGASLRHLQESLPALTAELFRQPPEGWRIALRVLALDRLNTDAGLNPGIMGRLAMTTTVGIGILLIACINFINLLTARSLRRAPEIGLRKLAGASRGALMAQFLGESLVHVIVAMLVGIALVELALPHVNTFLGTGIDFGYWREPEILAAIACGALLLGLLAGAWPALVISRLPPMRALKGAPPAGRTTAWRQGLVTLQFAILIGLIIAAGVVHQQRLYATYDAIQLDTDQMLLIHAPCNAFATELRQLPGVRGLACSGRGMLGGFGINTFKSRQGIEQAVFLAPVSPGLFDLYGVKPVAGQLIDPTASWYVLNEAAARRLGHADPADAVGMWLPAREAPSAPDAVVLRQVAGVVPDFSLTSVEGRIEALAYQVLDNDYPGFDLINVKLTGLAIPETLAAIDAAWKRTGSPDPLRRYFIDEHVQRLYTSMLRVAQTFAAFSVIAVVLACLGLFGLAASIAERRRREIGVRKALGAQQGDVLKLLLWQFGRPVVWANLIAWPAAGWAMQRWLDGFAYRIDLPLWLFPVAAVLALVIALLTVSAHSLRVARARPVVALRHE